MHSQCSNGSVHTLIVALASGDSVLKQHVFAWCRTGAQVQFSAGQCVICSSLLPDSKASDSSAVAAH